MKRTIQIAVLLVLMGLAGLVLATLFVKVYVNVIIWTWGLF